MAEINTPDAKRQGVIFDSLIRKKYGDSMNLPPWVVEAGKKKKPINHSSFVPYKDDEEEISLILENDVIDMDISLVDALVNAKVLFYLRQGEGIRRI